MAFCKYEMICLVEMLEDFFPLSLILGTNKLECLPCKRFHSSLILFGKVTANQSGALLQGWLLALPANIRLSRKGFQGTNTLAYFASSSVTGKKVL